MSGSLILICLMLVGSCTSSEPSGLLRRPAVRSWFARGAARVCRWCGFLMNSSMTDTEMTDMVTTDAAIEASNPLERRIEMTVVLAEIEKDVEQRLKQMSRSVKMPGFRPGKVPMKMVAQQYGSQARSDAIGAAVEKAYGEKVREQQLRVAGYPRIEPKADVGAGQLGFTAVFEVYPDIVPADISGQAIEKPTLTVTDAEVDKTIEVLRKQRTTSKPRWSASRPARPGASMWLSLSITSRPTWRATRCSSR